MSLVSDLSHSLCRPRVRTDTTKKWGLSMRNPGPRAAGAWKNIEFCIRFCDKK